MLRYFSFLQVPQTVRIFVNKLSSDNKSLLIFTSFQGWVFNVVPWLVAIPTSLFSGFLSDHLINQGESSLWLFLSSYVIWEEDLGGQNRDSKEWGPAGEWRALGDRDLREEQGPRW